MTFLPVVERELRVASRQRGSYWSRQAAALAGWGVAAWTLLAANVAGPQNGSVVFHVLSWLVFAYVALAGLLSTGDCLSEEKREGTLGLLFLTDLKGYDVIFGKLASTSIRAVCGALAVAPALAVSIVLGAVTQGEIVRVMLASLNLLFFFLSVGMFASALCRQDNRSLALGVILSVALMTGIPAVARLGFLHLANPDKGFIFSPAFGAFAAFEDYYNRFPHAWFWLNGLMTQLYAWALLGVAGRVVPQSWQDSKPRHVARRSLVKTKSVRGSTERKEVLAVNVFFWRAAQPATHRGVVWLALLGLALLWFVAGSVLRLEMFDVSKDILAIMAAGVVVKAWLASEASATLSADKRNAAMELLLTTPLAEDEIIKGQRMALWRSFAEPATFVFLANMFLLMMEIIHLPPAKMLSDDRNLLVGLHLIVSLALWSDLLALSWVGMWQGLIKRKTNRAAMLALFQILIVPYLLFFALYVMGSGGAAIQWFSGLIFPSIFGVASSFFFALNANSRLHHSFRQVVSEGKPAPLVIDAEAAGTPALEGVE